MFGLEKRRVADQRVRSKDERMILRCISESVMFEVTAALAMSFEAGVNEVGSRLSQLAMLEYR